MKYFNYNINNRTFIRLLVILLFLIVGNPYILFSQSNNYSEPLPDANLGIIFYAQNYGDTVVHIIWDEYLYNGNPVKEIIIEKSYDGINFVTLSQTYTNNLFDIHVNNYPPDIQYFNTILYSTEHGNGRFIYNDVYNSSFLKNNEVFYRLIMKTYDNNTFYSDIISKDGIPISHIANHAKDNNNKLLDNPKPSCPPVSSPPSGYISTGQTQTIYGTCCYYVQTLYQSNNPVQSPCGGSSYSWCCNNVPGASGCPSGWTSDPCCVHYCNQYYSCACTPWTQCCSASQVSQWVVTQSVTFSPFTLSISTTNETCAGMANGSATLTITGGTPPYTISWSNGQSGLTINNLSAGVYTVTVTDAANCTGTATATITANPSPSVSINTVNVRCFGLNDGQATATVTGGTAPYNYTWGPSGIAGNTPVASSLYAGTYTLTVTDANTCQTVTQIVINEPTLLGYSYSTTDLLCYGDSDGIIDITPSGGVAPYNYTWAPNVSSSNSASGLTAGTYTITITDANGCDTVANIDINQPPQLVLSTTGNYSACLNETVTFGASATGGVTPYVFDWDNGLGQGDSFTITATTTTTYNVTVTDANNCTSGPLSLTITVYPPLALNVVANPSNICDGDPVVLTATGGGGNGGPYTYTWDNGINTNSSSVTVFPNVTTTYSVTVSDNCTTPLATASTIVTVYPTPTASFTSDVFNGCQPFTVNFIDLSSPNNIQSWAWNFGDPSSGANNSSNQQNPTHTFNQSGTYNISLSVTTPDGCKNTYVYNNMITVYPKPIPSFVATPNPGSTLNSLITFSDASIYASYWNWNFGDNLSLNNTSNLPSPTHTYLSAGDYVVTLVVTSDYGCIDSTTNIIKILQDFMFWAPNAFTPNENGINDIWKPYGVNIDPDNYELYIYDRWGKEIFFTRDINQGWDGTINNTPAQEGIYNWLCKVKELNGKKHIYKGRITLYR